jgi:hypothetical protein
MICHVTDKMMLGYSWHHTCEERRGLCWGRGGCDWLHFTSHFICVESMHKGCGCVVVKAVLKHLCVTSGVVQSCGVAGLEQSITADR